MAKIKITLILTALAFAGWRPLVEQKDAVVRMIATRVMRSVVLEQSSFRTVETVAARPAVRAKNEECTCKRPTLAKS